MPKGESDPPPRRTMPCLAGIVAALVGVNVAGGVLRNWLHWWAMPVIAWVATIVLLVLAAMVLGRGGDMDASRLGVLIDQRNKLSLSRAQMALWWLLVASTILTEGIVNAIVTDPKSVGGPLQLAIPVALGGLVGLSAASAVGSPAVLAAKEIADVTVERRSPGQHDWRDLFRGDDAANADCIDGSKLQQIVLTLAVVLAYAIGIGRNLAGMGPATPARFPPLDSGLVGLMAASHAAYLGYKALPQARLRASAPPAERLRPAGGAGTIDEGVQVGPAPTGRPPPTQNAAQDSNEGKQILPTPPPPPDQPAPA